MKKMGRGRSAADYLLSKNLVRELVSENGPAEYYFDDESVGNTYDPHGLLAQFGIKKGDIIDEDYMRNLCSGLHPITGKPLINAYGDKHVAGMDVAMAPPKSFSAVWAIAPPELRHLLEVINRKANDAALNHLNDHASFTRTGHGGKEHIQSNFMAFQFQHGSSREQEPHLHIHNAIMNLSFVDGKWRSMETRHLMQWQTSANAIYMATQINELKKLGIETKLVGHHYEIVGVPEELIDRWSTRKKQITANAVENGYDISDLGGREKAFNRTRKDKKQMLDPHTEWTQQANAYSFTLDKVKSLFNKVIFKKEQQHDNREQYVHGVSSRNEFNGDSPRASELRLIRDRGIQLKPSRFAAAALQSIIARTKSIGDAAKNGMRIMSGFDLVSASKRDKMLLSSNAHVELSEWSGASRAVRWPNFSVTDVAESKLSDELIMSAAQEAIIELHETQAAIAENDLHRNITEKLFGESPERISKTINKILSGEIKLNVLGEVVELGEEKDNKISKINYFTTTYFQKIEAELAENATLLDGDGKHALDVNILKAEIAKIGTLSEEQEESCLHFFSSGSMKVGEGAAGVGKTFSMKPVCAAYEKSGYTVYAVAQADTQKDVLGQDLGLPQDQRKNIAQLLYDVGKGKITLTDKDVLILDEAGLVGSKSMNDVLRVVKESGCKILITGEEGQLSSVAAGPGFKILMNNVKEVSSIDTIIRQKDELHREMVQHFRKGQSKEGLAILNSKDGLHFKRDRKAQINALIDDWNKNRKLNQSESSIILALKNIDVRELNIKARECLKRSGDITGNDIVLTCDVNHDSEQSVNLPFAVGDQIILSKKDRDLEITNGTRAKIKAFRQGNGSEYHVDIVTEDGREITLDTTKYIDGKSKALPIKHGYAIAKWPSQGMTVDHTYLMGGEDDLRYSYVGLSRFKKSVNMYVSESQIQSKIREFRDEVDKDLIDDPDHAEREKMKGITREEMMVYLARRMKRKSIKLSSSSSEFRKNDQNADNPNAEIKVVGTKKQNQSFSEFIANKLQKISLESLKKKFVTEHETPISQ